MAGQLGPIEINCDAPPYPIVQACHDLGIQTPEDVRWCRLSCFLRGSYGRRQILNLDAWKAFLGTAAPREAICSCGQKLPPLEKYTFTFLDGDQSHYQIGQCGRCRTVFWDEL
jgi:hypothetical protein